MPTMTRAAHDAVADVELLDLGDGRHGDDVPVGQAVPGMHGQAHVGGVPRGAPKLVEARVAPAPAVRIAAGVQLDRGHAQILGRIERGRFGIDEEAHPRAGFLQPADRLPQPRSRSAEVEPAFGGDFLAPLRHDGGLVGPEPAGEGQHVRAGRQLEIEHADRRREALDVRILDVATVLPQVHGDAVRAGGLGEPRGLERVGLVGAAGLPDGRDVVDVDVEPLRDHCSALRGRLASHA